VLVVVRFLLDGTTTDTLLPTVYLLWNSHILRIMAVLHHHGAAGFFRLDEIGSICKNIRYVFGHGEMVKNKKLAIS